MQSLSYVAFRGSIRKELYGKGIALTQSTPTDTCCSERQNASNALCARTLECVSKCPEQGVRSLLGDA